MITLDLDLLLEVMAEERLPLWKSFRTGIAVLNSNIKDLRWWQGDEAVRLRDVHRIVYLCLQENNPEYISYLQATITEYELRRMMMAAVPADGTTWTRRKP